MASSPEINQNESRIKASALGLSRYAPRGATLVTGVLLIEIGNTFGAPIGVTNQLNATHSFLALLTALAMGVISIKLSMSSLLFAGLTLSVISAVGCYLSISFQMLFLLYALNGIAWSLIYPMSTALVGEIYSQENRAKMFSIIFAVPPIITVFGSPLIAYIGDWRMALLLFAIPIAITSLVLVKLNIPPLKARKEISLVSAFKTLATNVSAISCLANFFLSSITWQIIGVLSISFLREYHQLPRETTSLIYSGFALAVFLGALSGGKIVDHLSIKLSTVSLQILGGVSAILFVVVPDPFVAAGLGVFACLLSGLAQPAQSSLTIEQTPEIRGSIMSLSSASDSLGGTVGAMMAGYLLLNYGWRMTGIVLGAVGILAGLTLLIFAKEMNRKEY